MVRSCEGYGLAGQDGSAILMARIVDREGRAIRPADVAAVEFCFCEFDRRLPRGRSLSASHRGTRLNVADVLFDTLRRNHWTMDAIGYNFRHQLDVGEPGFQETNAHAAVCYTFKPRFGPDVAVLFQLGSILR